MELNPYESPREVAQRTAKPSEVPMPVIWLVVAVLVVLPTAFFLLTLLAGLVAALG